MLEYAVFLRGINVGGINIKMAELRSALSAKGFEQVRTVLASGNVLLDADVSDAATLKSMVEACLREQFEYDAWVVVADLPTLRRIIDDYPFDRERPGWHAYVMLASDQGSLDELLASGDSLDPSIERIRAGDGVIYWEVERGRSVTSTFGKSAAKARYRATTTTRNLRTLKKMLA